MIVALVILIAIAAAVFIRARKNRVGHDNVNEEWTATAAPEPEHAAT